MAFTEDFKYDIFISYSHVDNYEVRDKPGWVDKFHDELESWLVRRFGHKKITIWRDDKKLKGNTLFDNRIEEAISQSALFFTLTSLNYLDSNYCRKELDWFYNQSKASRYGLHVNNESRIFNILLRNIPHPSWPEELSGVVSFPMHDAPEKSDEAGEPIDPDSPGFRKALRKIVDAVDSTLHSFPKDSGPDKEGALEKETYSIFIADTADSLQGARDRLIADLAGENIHILDDIPPPIKNDEHEKAATKAINEAKLAIHLLDELPGRKIMDLKTTTYPQKQLEIGLKSNTPQLIWIPKHLEYKDIENAQYGEFLRSVENGDREEKRYEFIRGKKTYLSDLIREKLNQVQQEHEDEAESGTILLDTHQKDQRFAFKLADYLSEKGLEIEFNQESKDPMSSLQNFEHYLKHASDLVIIFGEVTPSWVLERLKRTIKLISTQLIDINKTTLENRWIYLLPSSKITDEIDNLVKAFRIYYLDGRHSVGIDEKVVNPLLAEHKRWGQG